MFNLQLWRGQAHVREECSSLGNVFNLQRAGMGDPGLFECSSLGNVFNLQLDGMNTDLQTECSSLGNVFNLQRRHIPIVPAESVAA